MMMMIPSLDPRNNRNGFMGNIDSKRTYLDKFVNSVHRATMTATRNTPAIQNKLNRQQDVSANLLLGAKPRDLDAICECR